MFVSPMQTYKITFFYYSGTNENSFDEHLKLEKRLYDLYSKKEQMASLVDELQIMNEVAHRSLVCKIQLC